MKFWKKKLAMSTLIVTNALLLGCQTSPTGRKQLAFMPDEQMQAMGAQAFDEMKTKQPVENNPAVNNYVKCVANAITNALPEKQTWEVVVFKDESANAFALPGGKIGVHTGLLKVAQTPAQLAAVLGHEVGHVLAEHGNERFSQAFAAQGALGIADQMLSGKLGGQSRGIAMAALGVGAQFGVLMPHGRKQESESDVLGLQYMAKAGFDPRQSVELWKNMAQAGGGQPPEFMSTHPSHENRIGNLQANMDEALKLYEAAGQRPGCKL